MTEMNQDLDKKIPSSKSYQFCFHYPSWEKFCFAKVYILLVHHALHLVQVSLLIFLDCKIINFSPYVPPACLPAAYERTLFSYLDSKKPQSKTTSDY